MALPENRDQVASFPVFGCPGVRFEFPVYFTPGEDGNPSSVCTLGARGNYVYVRGVGVEEIKQCLLRGGVGFLDQHMVESVEKVKYGFSFAFVLRGGGAFRAAA